MAASKQQNKKHKGAGLKKTQEEWIMQVMKDNPDMTRQEAVAALHGINDLNTGKYKIYKTGKDLFADLGSKN